MEIKNILLGFMIALLMIMCIFIIGDFVYQSEVFIATVTEIEYFSQNGGITGGSTKVIIEFNDGRVYNFYKLPSGLRKSQTYKLEYRTPYLLRDPYLVVIDEIE